MRARSKRPFGLHLLIPALASKPDREKKVLDWVLDGRTRFVTTGYGDPTRYIGRLKDAGVVTYHLTDSLDEALRTEDAGVDGIVLGGAETRAVATAATDCTFSLCCRRRAGGIVDGHGMAAAFALGAEGVWMGARFITSLECPRHDNYKQAIVDAEQVIAIDMGLALIPQMRAVRNPFAEVVDRGEAGHKNNPYAGEAMKLFYEGRTDLALVGCGETAVLIDEVKPASEIVKDTVREFWEEIDRLSGLRKGVQAGPTPNPHPSSAPR